MYFTLLRLLFKSNSLIVKITIYILPFVLSLIVASLLFCDNLLVSYQNYLTKSYIGVGSRLFVGSDNKKFLDEMLDESKKDGFLVSRHIQYSDVFEPLSLKTKKKIDKKISLHILDDSYLHKKFKTKSCVVVNNILAKIVDEKRYLLNGRNILKPIKIDTKYKMDSGFLVSNNIIFLCSSLYKKSFKNIYAVSGLEYSLTNDNDVKYIKQIARKISHRYLIDSLIFKDAILDNKELKVMFSNIKIIEVVFLSMIIVLSLVIIILSFGIIVTLKRYELDIVRIVGIPLRAFYALFGVISFLIFTISVLFGVLFFSFMKIFFIRFVDLDSSFFIPLSSDIWCYIFGFISFFSIFISFVTRFYFSKNIKPH